MPDGIVPETPVVGATEDNTIPVVPEIGGASPPEKPAVEVAPEVPADADLQTKLTELETEHTALKTQAERDLRNLRSSLDRRRAQDLAARDADLDEAENRMHAMATANMDETEQLRYNLSVAEQRLVQQKARTADQAVSIQASQNMNQYAKGFMEMGVKYDQLNFGSPETLVTSGYAALEENRQGIITENTGLKAQIDALKKGAPTPVTAPTAPPVVTTHGVATSQTKSMGQLLKSLEAEKGFPVTENQMYEMIDQGRLNSNILSGLVIP